MAKIVRLAVAAGTIAAGIITANPALIAQGTVMLASVLLTPKQRQQQRQASEMALKIGEHPRAAIVGTAATGGTLIDAFNYGGDEGTDWETMTIALADHRCKALRGFYVDDKYVAFTDDGAVPGYRGQLRVSWRPGTEDQALPSVLTNHGWDPDWNLAGVSFVVVQYKADDPEEEEPLWGGGTRPRFLWVVDGAYCYIARKDSTLPGGDGPHRYDDPSTWEWTDNPIDCRYAWVRGFYACDRIDQPDMLLVGRGLSAMEAPPENTFARANVCDELVARKDGALEKRYRVGGVIRADEEFAGVEEMFAAACAGVIVQPEGSVEIDPGVARAPVAFITDDDLVAGEPVEASDFRSQADDEWFNTVIPRYNEPTQKWADHAAPIRRVVADVIADGKAREETLSLTMVSWGTQAQRCGEIRRRDGRLLRRRTIPLPPPFAEIEEGDIIAWTSKRYGVRGAEPPVPIWWQVQAYNLGPDWRNRLTLREYRADTFDYDAANDERDDGAVTEQQVPPIFGAPGEAAWTLSAEAESGDGATLMTLVFSGTVDQTYASSVVFEYAQGGVAPAAGADGAWTAAGEVARTAGEIEFVVRGISGGITFWGAVSYRTAGIVRARRVIGPATTAVAIAPNTLLSGTGGTGSAEITWRNSTNAIFAYSKLFRGAAADDLGDAVAISGELVGGLGAMQSYTDTVAAGAYRYWSVAYSGDDVASVPLGPLALTVT